MTTSPGYEKIVNLHELRVGAPERVTTKEERNRWDGLSNQSENKKPRRRKKRKWQTPEDRVGWKDAKEV